MRTRYYLTDVKHSEEEGRKRHILFCLNTLMDLSNGETFEKEIFDRLLSRLSGLTPDELSWGIDDKTVRDHIEDLLKLPRTEVRLYEEGIITLNQDNLGEIYLAEARNNGEGEFIYGEENTPVSVVGMYGKCHSIHIEEDGFSVKAYDEIRLCQNEKTKEIFPVESSELSDPITSICYNGIEDQEWNKPNHP